MKAIFITGTDTNIGKTYTAVALLHYFNAQGYRVLGIKPLAAGAEIDQSGRLFNEDARALMQASSLKKSYAEVNPILLNDPIAPHLAAENMNIRLDAAQVAKTISLTLANEADIILIEGAGGWAVPLNEKELYSDVICSLKLPVILVVGIKLGCLNHAIITSQSMLRSKIKIVGWIANCLTNEETTHANIQFLKKYFPFPLLCTIPHNQSEINDINSELSGLIKAIPEV